MTTRISRGRKELRRRRKPSLEESARWMNQTGSNVVHDYGRMSMLLDRPPHPALHLRVQPAATRTRSAEVPEFSVNSTRRHAQRHSESGIFHSENIAPSQDSWSSSATSTILNHGQDLLPGNTFDRPLLEELEETDSESELESEERTVDATESTYCHVSLDWGNNLVGIFRAELLECVIGGLEQAASKFATEGEAGNAQILRCELQSRATLVASFVDDRSSRTRRPELGQSPSGGLSVEVGVNFIKPELFAEVHAQSDLNWLDIKRGFSMESLRENALAVHFSHGQSVSFFIHSSDKRFILKTLDTNEVNKMNELLVDYVLHLKQYPKSLLCRYFGLFEVVTPSNIRCACVIMDNMFKSRSSTCPLTTFDLKGSTANRKAREGASVLLDRDWLESGCSITMEANLAREFVAQAKLDADLLMRHNLMDYSLLVGIEDLGINDVDRGGHDDPQQHRHSSCWQRIPGQQGKIRYHLGIVDFLLNFTFLKYLEGQVKSCCCLQPIQAVTSIPPADYSERFAQMVEHAVRIEDTAGRQSQPWRHQRDEDHDPGYPRQSATRESFAFEASPH